MMAHQRLQSKAEIQVQATGIVHIPICPTEQLDAALDEIVELLGIQDEAGLATIRRQLEGQAGSYLVATAFKAQHPSPQASMRAVGRVAESLRRALADLELVSIEHNCVLDMELTDRTASDPRPVTLMETRHAIEQLAEAASHFELRYRPSDRRPRNAALEMTVGALMLLFERTTGKRATAALKPNGDHAPRLSSKEARAISILLRAVDSKVTNTAIANKIVEIRKEHKGRDLSEYAPMLCAGLPVRVTPF